MLKTCIKCAQVLNLSEFYRNKGDYHAQCKTCAWFWQVEYRFKLPKDLYLTILATQNGVCAICKKPESAANRNRLSVDHDHACCDTRVTCGYCVRGLLCNSYNVLVARVEDFRRLPDWLTYDHLSAILKYLEFHAEGRPVELMSK